MAERSANGPGAGLRQQADESLLRSIDTWLFVFVTSRNGVLSGLYEKYTGVKLPPLPVLRPPAGPAADGYVFQFGVAWDHLPELLTGALLTLRL